MQISGLVNENIQLAGSIGEKPPVQQNQNPVIFSRGVDVGQALSMSAAHSNIARLVTKSENGATGIGTIINKEGGKFAEDITLSSALEKLKSAQDYNEDMKAVVLSSIEKASSNEDKIAVLEKGLAFLETEKKLSECVQSGKMGLDEAKALLAKSLDFGGSKDFSLEKLNEFNEFSMNEQDGSTIQQKASEVFSTEVSTVSSPVNNNQTQPQSTTQPPKDQKVAPEKTNHSSISKTIDTKVFNESEHGEAFKDVVSAPHQQQSETKSSLLPMDNPQLKVVNPSVMELISGNLIEGLEVPSSVEKEDNEGNNGNDSQSVNNETATFGINESAEHDNNDNISDVTHQKITFKDNEEAQQFNDEHSEVKFLGQGKKAKVELYEGTGLVRKVFTGSSDFGEEDEINVVKEVMDNIKFLSQEDQGYLEAVALPKGVISISSEQNGNNGNTQAIIYEKAEGKNFQDATLEIEWAIHAFNVVFGKAFKAGKDVLEGNALVDEMQKALKETPEEILKTFCVGISTQDQPEEKVKNAFEKHIIPFLAKKEKITLDDVKNIGNELKNDFYSKQSANICKSLQGAFKGIVGLHKAGFIYDDLKPDNMMMGPPPKVIDLGECIDITKSYEGKTAASTGYTPNEVDNTQASDVHKMGLCVAQTLLGEFGNEFIVSLTGRNVSEGIARNIQKKFDFKPGEKGEYINNLYNALPGLLKEEQFKEYIPSVYSDAQLEFLGNLIKDCINPELTQRPTSEQMLAIFERFSAEPNAPVPNYEYVKTQAIKDHPKDLPPVLMAKIFSKDKKEMDQAFKALEKLVQDDPSYIKTPTYGLAMLRYDQKKITITSKYGQWKKENKDANDQLLDHVCLEGMELQDGKGIPLTLHKMQLLKDANKDGDQNFKTRPMYGLYLFKKGETEKFQTWATKKENNKAVDSDAFTKLQNRIYLEGMSHYTGKGIGLSVDDIVKLGDFDARIQKTTIYKLANIIKDPKNKLTSGNKLQELRERAYIAGSSNPPENGIEVPADVYTEIHFLSFDEAKKLATEVLKHNATTSVIKALKGIEESLEKKEKLETKTKNLQAAIDTLGKEKGEDNEIVKQCRELLQLEDIKLENIKTLRSFIQKSEDGSFIAEGSFGEVHNIKKDGKTYAVKIAKNTDDKSKADFEQEKAANEYLKANLSENERKYFVDYYGGFEIDGKFVFITEFIDSPGKGRSASFDGYINNVHNDNGCTKEDFDTMTKLLQQGFERVAIEQRIGLLNRDIKPENFMVSKDADGNLQLKGMDYGTACTYTGIAEPSAKGVGSPMYMAPEVLNQLSYSFSRDVYSMGISLIEGVCGGVFSKSEFRFPWKIAEFVTQGKLSEALKNGTFDGLANDKVITQEQLNKLKENLDNDEQKIGFLASLVADCTAFNPQERITAGQAAYLLKKFNEGNYDYNAVRSEAIQNHPKAIPDLIMDRINSSDSEIQEQGVNALKSLVLADPSCIETQIFKDLNETVASEIKKSDEYCVALLKLGKNEDVVSWINGQKEKEIPSQIITWINTDINRDPKEVNAVSVSGVLLLEKLTAIESSYKNTVLYNELDKKRIEKIKASSEYKSALGRLQNEGVKTDLPVAEKSVPNPETGNETISQSIGLNIDLNNEFAGATIIQELETILSDNFDALSKAQDFALNPEHDVHKLNKFLSFVQENTHTPEEINAKADELFKA